MEMWPDMPLWDLKIAFDLNHRFCSDVVFSSAGSVGQKLAGHLWASSNCCDCVISLLMKKPGETFDLENAHTAFVLLSLCEWLNEKPNHQMISFSFTVCFLSMFAYLWWCFNNRCRVKCTMNEATATVWLAQLFHIPLGLTWEKWHVC